MWKSILYLCIISSTAKNMSRLYSGKYKSNLYTPVTLTTKFLSKLDSDIVLWIAEGTMKSENRSFSPVSDTIKQLHNHQNFSKIRLPFKKKGNAEINSFIQDVDLNNLQSLLMNQNYKGNKMNNYKNRNARRGTKVKKHLKRITDFPYIAAVMINDKLECTGTLVDEYWVLTTAHCLDHVFQLSPWRHVGPSVQVRLGSVSPKEGGQLIHIVTTVRHPEYRTEKRPHADVALLQLSRRVETCMHIRPIKIYEVKEMPLLQSFIEITAWGFNKSLETDYKDTISGINNGFMNICPPTDCADVYQLDSSYLNDTNFAYFCAKQTKSFNSDCLLHAGAPAIQNDRMVGIMSFRPERCEQKLQIAVFVKSYHFGDFIKKIISSSKTARLTEDVVETDNQNNGESDEIVRREEENCNCLRPTLDRR